VLYFGWERPTERRSGDGSRRILGLAVDLLPPDLLEADLPEADLLEPDLLEANLLDLDLPALARSARAAARSDSW
jgi:hypothetical protein